MLRRDTSARFFCDKRESGFWHKRVTVTYQFYCNGLNFFSRDSPGVKRTPEEYDSLLQMQQNIPVKIVEGWSRRTWWMFKDEFYWEDEGYTALEVQALVLKRIRDKQKRLKRAKTLIEQEEVISSARREVISDDIKIFVWRRDEGKCVKCGSKENLEFDHIIPISKGGSNTARNIQILCENCNREKGDSIAF
jgi:hypothetical protein